MTTGDYPHEHYATRLTPECNCALCVQHRAEKAADEAFWNADEWTPDHIEQLNKLKAERERNIAFTKLTEWVRTAALFPPPLITDVFSGDEPPFYFTSDPPPHPSWAACDFGSSADEADYAPVPGHPAMRLTDDSEARKRMPLTTGVLDYFPDALAAVAELSFAGNEKHNPGQALHWSRGKSNDHADCIPRHLVDRGTFDKDGTRHTAALAWRALALLQLEIEAERALPPSRGSR